MIWRCHGILCFHLHFKFRNNAIREQLDENDFRRCYGFFFESVIPITAMFEVLSRHLDNGIWKTSYNWRLHEHGSTKVSSQDIWLIISFSQTSLIFKFNLMLIEQFLPRFIYLSTFWYFVFLEVHPVPLRSSKGSMLFFCEGLQSQNVIFFPMKH